MSINSRDSPSQAKKNKGLSVEGGKIHAATLACQASKPSLGKISWEGVFRYVRHKQMVVVYPPVLLVPTEIKGL